MELLPDDRVVSLIRGALAEGRGEGPGAALAFDGDGTLWSGDVGEDFFEALLDAGRFLPPAVDAMMAVGRAVGLEGMVGELEGRAPAIVNGTQSLRDTGVALARRLFDGYLDHLVPEDVICEVIAWACAGWREEEVTALAHLVVKRTGLESRRHREVGRVLDWGRSAGLDAFLVSASPRPIVEAAAAAWGFDRAHILATTAPFADGIMLPTVERPIPYGPGKAALLAARLEGRPLLAAFGDNVFDVPMLQAARVAVLVEPKARLLDHLATLSDEGAGFVEGRPPVRLLIRDGAGARARERIAGDLPATEPRDSDTPRSA